MFKKNFFVIKQGSNNYMVSDCIFEYYAPIIGRDAAHLYKDLLCQYEHQRLIGNIGTNLIEFLKYLEIDTDLFDILIKKLEAIDLIKTFVIEKENTSTYYFQLNCPKSYEEFISNQKFRHLLLKKIGQKKYEEIEYIHNTKRIPADAINISSTFEKVFGNVEDLESISHENFDKLYEKIIKDYPHIIVFDDTSKSIIESYFKTYDLTIREISRCIYDSIVKEKGETYKIDSYLLQIELKKFVDKTNNVNVLKNIRLNRNAKMFAKHFSKDDIQHVFNDYKILNSEQYLRAINKLPLEQKQLNLINTLRNKYFIPDNIINLMVDFSLFKTSKVNEKYILKMVSTINALNLNSLQEIYDYLTFKNTTIKFDDEENKNLEMLEWSN
ncbi:MAG: hypothetical protein LBD05_01965 [Mycoplasmataceae bacterium]|jgi:replication initiation and membrane attachment protein|nr:hypothetical protein [Mycoplasmataceae bacterium]